MRNVARGHPIAPPAVWLAIGALALLATGLPARGMLALRAAPDGAVSEAVAGPSPGPTAAAFVLPEPSPTTAPVPTPTPRSVPTPPAPPPVASPRAAVASPAAETIPAASPTPWPSPAAAAACSIGDSFVRLAEALGEARVGRCLEGEYVNVMTGNTHQRTTRGLLVWLKERGTAAFTDGANTWYGCADALERRAAEQAFAC